MTRLNQLRTERGVSYNRLAALTGNVATPESLRSVSIGETKNPRYETKRALEAVFGEPIDSLLADADERAAA